ncbi:Protein kinase, catalytic domain-containing protein [Artemisia annua]|uniref:Protein kinase, catalytic domain-containing protein n=1 Tax=Artemisia annua TaxID=35608 RepID=A0A2U1NS44_ARTAN|nr:Protein kinase, catalytic domain-containing protein [Artemisia annua]
MVEPSSVNGILEFLKTNKLDKAEAAFRNEIGNRGDLNGFLQGLKLEEAMAKSGVNGNQQMKEFVVKEMENGNPKNGFDSKRKNVDKSYTSSSNNTEETVLEKFPKKFSSSYGSVDVKANDVKEYSVSSQSNDKNRATVKVGVEKDFSADRKQSSMSKIIEPKEFMDNPWSRNDEIKYSSSESWNACSVKTVFPSSKGDASTSYDTSTETKAYGGLGFPVISEKQKEELPRLAPVKVKLDDKQSTITWEEKHQRDGPGSNVVNGDSSFLIGSFLDVPIGQELNNAGGKRLAGGNWFSVSQGITDDTSDLVSGFATIGDDETWFLAHEIDYPSDNEKKTDHGNSKGTQENGPEKIEDDDQSFAEEDSYLSGDQYFLSKNVDPVHHLDDMTGQYDGQLMDEDELMRPESVWKEFVSQTDELLMLTEGQILGKTGRPHMDDLCIDEDQHGSVRSIGVGINSDVADFGSEVRESEGELEYNSSHDSERKLIDKAMKDKPRSSGKLTKNMNESGFSFPPPRNGQPFTGSNRADNAIRSKENADLIPPWRQKSSSSSPVKSSRDEDDVGSADSSPSTLSNYNYAERARQENQKVGGLREPGASLEDEEAAAVQEQLNQMKAQAEEYETFNLKIVHRKNSVSPEMLERQEFHVVLNL